MSLWDVGREEKVGCGYGRFVGVMGWERVGLSRS